MTYTWITQKGYSIETQLISDGLSFEAFDLIERTIGKSHAERMRRKIVGRLGKNLRADCLEDHKLDIAAINYGVYCMALGGEFTVKYTKRNSRIIYIGSGAVYGRIKSHLSSKLFDFASSLRNVPLRFHICDLKDHSDDPKLYQRKLEQSLLQKFAETIDEALPLLNKKKAVALLDEMPLEKSWDKPLHRFEDRNLNWQLSPTDFEEWKGSI